MGVNADLAGLTLGQELFGEHFTEASREVGVWGFSSSPISSCVSVDSLPYRPVILGFCVP